MLNDMSGSMLQTDTCLYTSGAYKCNAPLLSDFIISQATQGLFISIYLHRETATVLGL